jgi:hypothetical protein
MSTELNTIMNGFYEGKTILLYGLGYLGKVVLEKLIRALSNVRRVYIPFCVGEVSPIDELLNSHVFNQLHTQNPEWKEDIKRILIPVEIDWVLPNINN